MDFTKFRENIRCLRKLKDLTAIELSVKANLKQPKRIADIEDGRGTPNLEEVISICEALDITIDNAIHREIKVSYLFQ